MSIRTVFISLVLSVLLFFTGFVLLKIDAPMPVVPKNDELLSLSEVVKALNADGIRLNVFRANLPPEFELNGVRPAVFKVNDTEDLLFVYIYQSLEERSKVYRHLDGANLRNTFIQLSFFQQYLPAKNALIVYLHMKMPPENAAVKGVRAIDEAVFTRLNDGRTVTYKGEGTLWKAQVIVKYYEHFWEDSGGVMRTDSLCRDKQFLWYKGDDIESVVRIIYEFAQENGMNKSGGSGIFLDQNGYADLGGGWGSGGAPWDRFYTVTVTWHDRSESFKVFREENIPPVSREPLVILE